MELILKLALIIKKLEISANTACDKNNFILDFVVNLGNIHDSKAFPELYQKLKNKYSGIKNIVVDAGYKIPAIAKLLIDDNITPIMPYKRPMTKYGFLKNMNMFMINFMIAIFVQMIRF